MANFMIQNHAAPVIVKQLPPKRHYKFFMLQDDVSTISPSFLERAQGFEASYFDCSFPQNEAWINPPWKKSSPNKI